MAATLGQFLSWVRGEPEGDNPLANYSTQGHWAYADYKHMAAMFGTEPEMLKVIFQPLLHHVCGIMVTVTLACTLYPSLTISPPQCFIMLVQKFDTNNF